MKTILITGCSTGIGHTVAHGLQRQGWRVFASARQPADVARLRSEGLNDALQLDVDDSLSINRALGDVLAATGGTLDALFNNAGFGQPGAAEDISRHALRTQFETNLFGAWELTSRVLPVVRSQGHGRILLNSSVLGFAAPHLARFIRFGKLPGDAAFQFRGKSYFFPVASTLLFSLLLWLISRLI